MEEQEHQIQTEPPFLELYEWLESGIVTVVGMLLLFTLLVRPATVNGPSMMKTLHDGDRLILQQVGYHDPQYGDIVVIDRTGTGEPAIVKRVIGRASILILPRIPSGATGNCSTSRISMSQLSWAMTSHSR